MELKIDKVIETVLYVSDIERADAFIERCCNCRRWSPTNGFCAYNVGDRSVLLLFIEGDSLRGAHYPTGLFPRTMAGPAHIGLAVAKDQLPHWERHLMANGVGDRGADALGTRRREHLFSRS